MSIFTKLADLIAFNLFKLDPASKLGDAVHFFIEDTTKIYVLLLVMIYLIALARAAVDTELIRTYLQGKKRGVAYVLASVFGAVTPFCSCSSIPLFLGFTSARIPLGITMAFLITSPMINEVAVILLGSMLGLKFMIIYVITGIVAGILGGFFIDRIGAEKHLSPLGQQAADAAAAKASASENKAPAKVKPAAGFSVAKVSLAAAPSATAAPAASTGACCSTSTASSVSAASAPAAPVCACKAGNPEKEKKAKLTFADRHDFAKNEVKEIFHRVWKWVLIGVGLGAGLHGFVPENFIADFLGEGSWWTVPGAVLVGIPLYANASGVIPVAQTLMAKGLPVGTTLAFMMSVVAASFPEFMMLKQVMKPKLLVLFFCMLLVFFTATGWLFNIVY